MTNKEHIYTARCDDTDAVRKLARYYADKGERDHPFLVAIKTRASVGQKCQIKEIPGTHTVVPGYPKGAQPSVLLKPSDIL